MAITPAFYGNGLLKICNGSIDVDTDTFKLLLATSSYTPNRDTHDFRDDVTNEVANGSGYTTGGVTLSGIALSVDATSHQMRIDCNDPSWTFTASVSWRYGVVYKSRGGASSADELLGLIDWGTTQTVSTSYTLQISATGLLYLDYT